MGRVTRLRAIGLVLITPSTGFHVPSAASRGAKLQDTSCGSGNPSWPTSYQPPISFTFKQTGIDTQTKCVQHGGTTYEIWTQTISYM